MEEQIITQEEWLAREQEREAHWEQKRKECGIKRPLNTYEECKADVNKWIAFDENHSFHSPLQSNCFPSSAGR